MLDEVLEKRGEVKRNVEKTKKKLRRKGKKTQDAIIKTEVRNLMSKNYFEFAASSCKWKLFQQI